MANIIKIGSKDVILCQQPSFMSCEENAFPIWYPHCTGKSFEINDLKNTGFVRLLPPYNRLPIEKLIKFYHLNLEVKEEIRNILESYNNRYAFFFEESKRPLEEGYICRCRFLREDIVPQLYRNSVPSDETTQPSSAFEILSAFFGVTSFKDPNLKRIYGDYYDSGYFRTRYEDEEQFCYGGGIVWEERGGILRAWTRMGYVPK